MPLPIEVPQRPRSPRHLYTPKEYKVVSLRDCPTAEPAQIIDTPERAECYWRAHIETARYFNPECEVFFTLVLNARYRIKGHILVSIGTMDTILVHPREVFRASIVMSAYALVVMHNHPSGDPTPSEADIKVTRDLIRAGQMLKIEVLDHVIIGLPSPERARPFTSLRELGYFYSA